jgi:uncharacterized protein YecT (DUF1311 family)
LISAGAAHYSVWMRNNCVMAHARGVFATPALAMAVAACASTSPAPASAPKSAAVEQAPSASDPCDYPESEEALLTCQRTEYERAESSIASLVGALRELYAGEPELLSTFETAQAKWREFRDAECAHRTYDSRGGTAFESYWLQCLRTFDRERAARLEYLKESP